MRRKLALGALTPYPRQSRFVRCRRNAAFTIVEVLMSITMLAVGASGIMALQKVVSAANQHARNTEVASRIATGWVEKLKADAVRWNHPSPVFGTSDLADAVLISAIGIDGLWHAPSLAGTQEYSSGDTAATTTFFGGLTAWHDALGNNVADAASGRFCVNVRLTAMTAPPPAPAVTRLIRADVRVFWLRPGSGSFSAGATDLATRVANGLCAIGTPDIEGGTTIESYFHVVHASSLISQNVAF